MSLGKNYIKVAAGCTMLILLFAGCKQVYDPQLGSQNIRLLVVEGLLNSGQGPTTIRLSRTADLNDKTVNPEFGAQVSVEGDNGSSIALTATIDGEYSAAQLNLNNGVKYRLHIITTDGKQYVS